MIRKAQIQDASRIAEINIASWRFFKKWYWLGNDCLF